MGDRATLERIFAIMRRLLLVPMDGDPIPRKGTTRHECYRALYEIQELLEARRYFGKHLPQTNADRIRSMTDEEMAAKIEELCQYTLFQIKTNAKPNRREEWLEWLKQEVSE